MLINVTQPHEQQVGSAHIPTTYIYIGFKTKNECILLSKHVVHPPKRSFFRSQERKRKQCALNAYISRQFHIPHEIYSFLCLVFFSFYFLIINKMCCHHYCFCLQQSTASRVRMQRAALHFFCSVYKYSQQHCGKYFASCVEGER